MIVEDASKRRQATSSPEARGKLSRSLRGDLDNIVLKALRKEPERRYASAEQMADDIRRHLQGLPVTATPDTVSYRLGRFLRRHRVGASAVAVLLLAIAAGTIATVREARIAEANRRRAEARFNDVRKLANSFLFEFDDAIRNLPGSTPARSLLVKRALEYLDGLASEARGDLSLQLEIASAYQKVAEVQGNPIYPNLGDMKGALESSRKSLSILEPLLREEPENQQIRLWLAGNHQQISDMLSFSGDTAGAVEHSGEALKMYDSLDPVLAGDRKFQAQYVSQTYHYANLLRLAGNLGESEAEYRKAVELSQQMIAARPLDPEGKIHLATSFDGLGYVLQEKGETASALENRRKGLALRQELVALDPNNAHYSRQLAFSHHNVGLSLAEEDDLTGALNNFRTELGLFESLSAADPKDAQARRNCSLAHKQTGDVLMRTHDFRGALQHYRAALDIDSNLTSIDPSNSQAVLDLSFSESKVGSALGKLGETQQASTILRNGIARQESLLAKDPHHILLYSELAGSYTLLGNLLLESGHRKDSIEWYQRAVSSRLKLVEKSPNSGMSRRALAQSYITLAKALNPTNSEDALRHYGSAIQVLEQLTAINPGNISYRIALAGALGSAAQLYAHAADREPAASVSYCTKASSLYHRGQELWLELNQTQKLTSTQRLEIQGMNAELARCDDSVAKLQQDH